MIAKKPRVTALAVAEERRNDADRTEEYITNHYFESVKELLGRGDAEKLEADLQKLKICIEMVKSIPEVEEHFCVLFECIRVATNVNMVRDSLEIISMCCANSEEASEWLVKYGFIPFLIEIYRSLGNSRCQQIILEIISNAMYDSQEICAACFQAGAMQLFFETFAQLDVGVMSPNIPGTDGFIDVIKAGITRPCDYPDLLTDELFVDLLTAYSQVLKNRHASFGPIVNEIIESTIQLLRCCGEARVHVFVEVGILSEINEIIVNEPLSNHWEQCFFFLGAALQVSPSFAFLAEDYDICEFCARYCAANGLEQFLSGFCSFLGSVFCVNNAQMSRVLESGFFKPCAAHVSTLPCDAQRSFVSLLLTVMRIGTQEQIGFILDQQMVSFVFDVLSAAPFDLITEMISAFDNLLSKFGIQTLDDVGLLPRMLELMENTSCDSEADPELAELATHIIESYLA